MPGGRGEVLAEGASGLGSRLSPGTGRDRPGVAAITRHPGSCHGAGTPVRDAVHDPATLSTARAGCQAACSLARSLSQADFPRKNADAAEALGEAVAHHYLDNIIAYAVPVRPAR